MMNERIKELAEKAQQYAEYVTPQGLEWFDAFKTKFAELIVKECTTLIEQSVDNSEYWSRTTGAESIIAIEQHFGFE